MYLAQRILIITAWTVGGILACGGLFDALINANSLMTASRSAIGTLMILTAWCAVEMWLRRYGAKCSANGGTVRVTRLGMKLRCAIVGVMVLMWIPQFVEIVPESRSQLPSKQDGPVEVETDKSPVHSSETLEQQSHGTQSPNIISGGGNVTVQYGTPESDEGKRAIVRESK